MPGRQVRLFEFLSQALSGGAAWPSLLGRGVELQPDEGNHAQEWTPASPVKFAVETAWPDCYDSQNKFTGNR